MKEDTEFVKCPKCKWVHFLVKDGEGQDHCFLCSSSAKYMLPADKGDCPMGCTVQGVNRSSYGRGKELLDD